MFALNSKLTNFSCHADRTHVSKCHTHTHTHTHTYRHTHSNARVQVHMATGRIASLTRNGFVNGLAEDTATSAGRLAKWHCGSVAVWQRECVACRWITHWHYQHRNRRKPTNGPEMTVLPLTNDQQRRHGKNNTKKSIHHATSSSTRTTHANQASMLLLMFACFATANNVAAAAAAVARSKQVSLSGVSRKRQK